MHDREFQASVALAVGFVFALVFVFVEEGWLSNKMYDASQRL